MISQGREMLFQQCLQLQSSWAASTFVSFRLLTSHTGRKSERKDSPMDANEHYRLLSNSPELAPCRSDDGMVPGFELKRSSNSPVKFYPRIRDVEE